MYWALLWTHSDVQAGLSSTLSASFNSTLIINKKECQTLSLRLSSKTTNIATSFRPEAQSACLALLQCNHPLQGSSQETVGSHRRHWTWGEGVCVWGGVSVGWGPDSGGRGEVGGETGAPVLQRWSEQMCLSSLWQHWSIESNCPALHLRLCLSFEFIIIAQPSPACRTVAYPAPLGCFFCSDPLPQSIEGIKKERHICIMPLSVIYCEIAQ